MLYQLNYIHRVRDCKGTKKIVPSKGIPRKNTKFYSFSSGIDLI